MNRKRLLCLLLAAMLLCCSACGQQAESPAPSASSSASEAPIDNLTMIVFLRMEARDNEGYIPIERLFDTNTR